MLNSQCNRRLTWSPKNADSTNRKQFPAYARVQRDVFHARLQWQGVVELYKRSIFFITETQFATQPLKLRKTKLYQTSACGCNSNTIFQNELLSRFLPSTCVPWQCRSCEKHEMAILMNSSFFVFKNSLLRNYRVK